MDKAGFSGGCKAALEAVIEMRVADFRWGSVVALLDVALNARLVTACEDACWLSYNIRSKTMCSCRCG
jgi:hypothetical protein